MGLVRTEMHLSALLDRQVVSPTGEGVGKVDDLIVRLRDRDRSDAEVADVISHMRADDAADAVGDLPQGRRQKVLDLLQPGIRTKVLTLMGFHSASAGGLMGIDALTAPASATVNEALDRVRLASSVQPEAMVTVHAVDGTDRLVGTVSIVAVLRPPHPARQRTMSTKAAILLLRSTLTAPPDIGPRASASTGPRC